MMFFFSGFVDEFSLFDDIFSSLGFDLMMFFLWVPSLEFALRKSIIQGSISNIEFESLKIDLL